MVSFYATFLCINIPIIDTQNIIKDYVNNDDQFNRKTGITQDRFLGLANLVLAIIWYTFNSHFYQQIDGVAMGGAASSTTAEIYMYARERTTISMALYLLKVWERFLDDAIQFLNLQTWKIFSIKSTSSKY